LNRTLGEVSALLFKVNQIWKMPDVAAGIHIRNKSRPAIEIKFIPILTKSKSLSFNFIQYFNCSPSNNYYYLLD